jgi:biotin operon repressor
MAKAFGIKVGNASRKLVLLKLADNANDQGECFPSYQHIADQCEMGRSTVKGHIKALADAGYLVIKERKRTGYQSSNSYKLTLDEGQKLERNKPNRPGKSKGSTADRGQPLSSDVSAADRDVSAADRLNGSAADHRTSHSFESVSESVNEPEHVPSDDVTELFDFWKTQMGKTDKAVLTDKRRRQIWKALKDYSLDLLKQAVIGCTLSPYHMGQNDAGKRYDDIELIVRDAKRVEQFTGYFEQKPKNVSLYSDRPRPKHTGLDQANSAGLTPRSDGTFSL